MRTDFVDDDDYDQIVIISKLCVTRSTISSTRFLKVVSNYGQLMKSWEICLQETLTREMRSRIIGRQSEINLFKFF